MQMGSGYEFPMEGHSGYLKKALNKEAGVIFKRAIGVTEPRALSLRRSEEEAQREHDLQKETSLFDFHTQI